MKKIRCCTSQRYPDSATIDRVKTSMSPKNDATHLISTYNNGGDGNMCILDAITADAMTSSFNKKDRKDTEPNEERILLS